MKIIRSNRRISYVCIAFTSGFHVVPAKAGVLNLTINLLRAYARDVILVNFVSPAYIATLITNGMMK